MIENYFDETNFSHKLLLTDTHVFRAFTNGSSANIKFSKTHLSKMIKSGEYLTDICGIASAIDSFVNFPI